MGRLNKWLASALFLGLCLMPAGAFAQAAPVLSLEQAQELAQRHYPVTRQRDLLRQTEKVTLESLRTAYLPQLSVSGQASYQSDVTAIPLALPNVDIPVPAKDQYKAVADISQLLYDGGLIRQQMQAERLRIQVESQRVEVELHQLRERVDQLYLGALLLDGQLQQVNLVEQDLQTGIRKVEAQVKNQVTFTSNLYLLQAELLKNRQRKTGLQASRKALLQTLGLLVGQPLDEEARLATPAMPDMAPQAPLQRPELQLYASQQSLLAQQHKLLRARNLPRANLFWQSGYGRPGLNFLLNRPDFWYLGGLRVSWQLGNFYTYRNDRQLIELNRQLTEVQRETFLLNTNARLEQQRTEMAKLQQLLADDEQIVALRQKVKQAANAQLENGVITANDYLREVYAEDQARQDLILHQLQLLQAQIQYRTLLGY